MIKFVKAYQLIQSFAHAKDKEHIGLHEVVGRVLAEDVVADADMPPFNRSAMDGYACRKSDVARNRSLKIIELVPAGKKPEKTVLEGTCTKIMTGAEVPEGADCVIKVEDTRLVSADMVEISKNGDISNIRRRGEDLKKGDVVIQKGTLLNTQHAGLLAMVGCVNPQVYRQPGVGIISTGSELVEPDKIPGIAGIRNSNSSQLLAQLGSMKIQAEDYGIIKDNKDAIRHVIRSGMKNLDVLLFSGGVSMGEFDYVPEVLRELGFDIIIHKIKVRPGMPLLFAVGGSRRRTFVFGLPGNPVSTFVQFEVIIRSFLLKMMGARIVEKGIKMVMGEDLKIKPLSLRYFLPVKIVGGLVYPLEYHGSGHLASYASANGILEIAENISRIKTNELVYVRPI